MPSTDEIILLSLCSPPLQVVRRGVSSEGTFCACAWHVCNSIWKFGQYWEEAGTIRQNGQIKAKMGIKIGTFCLCPWTKREQTRLWRWVLRLRLVTASHLGKNGHLIVTCGCNCAAKLSRMHLNFSSSHTQAPSSTAADNTRCPGEC